MAESGVGDSRSGGESHSGGDSRSGGESHSGGESERESIESDGVGGGPFVPEARGATASSSPIANS